MSSEPWNDREFKCDPFAPHNDPLIREDPSKPWNGGSNLTEEEKKYYGIEDDNDNEYLKGLEYE